ncbi:conserved hypothetical protein [Candidatus Sulfopaludibacter sp. SbA3]|nr:conserved hypothetical protein [Candidatus Sulfopaludibacter sp. SbA3]
MHVPELVEYCQQFEAVAEQAKELTAGLTEAQFNWRPTSTSWSIEECLAHLVMVGNVEVKALERAIETAKSRGITGEPPFHYGMIDRYVVGLTVPPARHQFSAPRRFQPLHGQPITGVLPSFLHLQSQFIRLVERSEGLHLARVKVETPISRFVRMSLGMMFAQISAHELRHLEQARKVREKV